MVKIDSITTTPEAVRLAIEDMGFDASLLLTSPHSTAVQGALVLSD